MRTPNTFEKILLVIGILILIIGYGLLNMLHIKEAGLTWLSLTATFVWLLLLSTIIIISVLENMKEELKEVILKQDITIKEVKDIEKLEQKAVSKKQKKK